ncbi:helix-turn-helix domain-containing protein [Nocardia higoensis]|uniref:Helix-turn-helix domain-containing protein n=1 Tax=Nocardia higoensis TaxID=228599 RepID=A0ABS0DK74_9NOCA|nr:helix-turn-helix transcriptional regulator [Nocardia higoensis]MBF6357404.1 helix-turn-helix domain-containing protein [Nocardia higoensis]
MDSHAAIVGAQLRAAREAAGMSLAALAGQIHYSKSMLSYFETGQRTPTPDVIAWYEQRFGGMQDAVATLLNLGKADVERRSFLRVGYSTALSSSVLLPGWLDPAVATPARKAIGIRHVGEADVAAVRDVMLVFSQMDQRLGGGHGRTAVVQYLTNEVTGYLNGAYASDQVRRDMFSAAAELTYLAGWMAFDNDEHPAAQRYFTTSTKLAAEADDAPLTGHILRAMAHQAIDLGHPLEGLQLAEASVAGARYRTACPRERALLKVVHAKALSAAGRPAESARALLQAEKDLADASTRDREPTRVFFFSEASLAHETACALRDAGDLSGAAEQFERSVRKRQATAFTRTHAVTLGYLGTVQARAGSIEQACATWSSALAAMSGVQSGRTRNIARDIRATVAPHLNRHIAGVREIDDQATEYLTVSSR